MKRPELLAPAGNLNILKLASHYGADAFYVGLKDFNLRINTGNFTYAELEKAIDILHSQGKRLYLTLNTYPTEEQIPRLKEVVNQIKSLPLDAVIVSDLGVLRLLNKYSDIPVIMSTQANIVNSEAIKFLKDFNVKRIILARELSLESIKQIREAVPDIELEVFCHGAMCMAISGRCLLSYYFTNRKSNQGDCPQVCRWEFALLEKTRPGKFWEIYEDGEYTYFLNSKDLCTIDILDKIIDAGIDALKIEGRNKTEFYVALISGVYSRALDLIAQGQPIPQHIFELVKVPVNRGFTHGFYIKGEENESISFEHLKAPTEYIYLGFFDENSNFIAKNKIEKGMAIKIVSPAMEMLETRVVDIMSTKKETQEYTRPAEKYILKLDVKKEIAPWSIAFGRPLYQ